MSLPGLILLMAAISPAETPASAPAGSIERIVVVLGQNDAVSSSRVLGQIKSCTDGRPTAVFSAFRELRIEQDFTGSQSLAARLPADKIAKSRTLPASLELLADALAPVGPTTAIVLVSPQIGADSGMGVASPDQLYIEGAESPPVDYYSTVRIPDTVIEARKALRRAGLTLVAVNTSGTYAPAVKALTEIPKGRYLQYSQRNFSKVFASAVCAAGR